MLYKHATLSSKMWKTPRGWTNRCIRGNTITKIQEILFLLNSSIVWLSPKVTGQSIMSLVQITQFLMYSKRYLMNTLSTTQGWSQWEKFIIIIIWVMSTWLYHLQMGILILSVCLFMLWWFLALMMHTLRINKWGWVRKSFLIGLESHKEWLNKKCHFGYIRE